MIKTSSRPITYWLFTCCGMVFVMAVIGAITRLTQSGLSITDWNPIMGAIPPLNDADWDKAFSAYQQIPQYKILNSGMSLEEFKGIFFWEWFHRLWGRMIGLVFLLPLIVFGVRKKIDRALTWRLCGIFALIGLQGFVGWFMVQSGLEVRTSVSPYRLAMHLGFALTIYSLMLWTGLGPVSESLGQQTSTSGKTLARTGWWVLGLLAVTMIWGALVAGLHAGQAYNTWPLMDGVILPSAAFTILPHWLNVFENLALVQFIHRWLAPTTMIVILAWVWLGLTTARHKKWFIALGAMSVFQVILGLATLISHANVILATMHQAGAIALLSLMLINLHKIKRLA
jgi:cytochrome c oxidase assembly protein subunit 15